MLRSYLFTPAANQKAMAKAGTLSADALILDLEDALALQQKDQGRAAVIRFLREQKTNAKPIAVRINAGNAALQSADIRAIASESPAALLIPKVDSAQDLQNVYEQMQNVLAGTQKPMPAIWAMIETPMGILNLKEIASVGRSFGLTCLIAGTNDLALALGIQADVNRDGLQHHLTQIVLHARAFGLHCIDGVMNDFSDEAGFAQQCAQGKMLGFEGKTLIHPSQIAPTNTAFGPSADAIKQAKAIVRAFSLKKNAGKGAINVGGQMAERLHLTAAKKLLTQLDMETKPK